MQQTGTSVELFQLLTSIEHVLKAYSHKSYNFDEIQRVLDQLLRVKLNSQMVFQHLISSHQKINELKYTIFKRISKITSEECSFAFQIEKQQKIDSEVSLQDEEGREVVVVEVLRKISAIKSEAMFVNQELSIKQMDTVPDQNSHQKLKRLSLRKLMKEYLKRSRSFMKSQSFVPLCIRMIVLQETIQTYLEKSTALMRSILEGDCKSDQPQLELTQIESMKSVSSLSASLQHYISNQTKQTAGISKHSMRGKQPYSLLQPTIRSEFVFQRDFKDRQSLKGEGLKDVKCCLWF